MYGHRQTTMTPRYLELMEALKAEYENMYQEVSMSKIHREDVEMKMHANLVDIAALQKALYELERAHIKAKQHYEDEIARLKHEVEEKTGHSLNPGTSAAALIQFPTPPNLEQELQGFASGFANLTNASHAVEHIPPGMYPPSKRSVEDDGIYMRNVRPREDQLVMPRRASGPPVSPMVPPTRLPPAAPTDAAMKKDSPTSATAATGSGFDWLVVYNPKASRSITIDLLHTMIHDNVVCCVKFSHDGKYLATGSNRIASIFDVKTGEKIATFSDLEGVAQESDQYIRSVAFSPNGKYLVTGCEDQMVRVWNIEGRKLKCKLSGHTQDIYAVDFMPDSSKVVSGSGDRTLRIWDIQTGKSTATLQINNVDAGKDAGITSVAVSPNGRYVAAGSLDKTIRLWDVDSGKALETLEGHRDSVYSVSFAPDGLHLISGSLDKTIKVWQFDSSEDIQKGTCKYTILGHKDFVLSVAGTPPDGRWVVSGSKDRSVQFWDSLTGTTQLMLQGHKNSVISVAISPTGLHFATGSGDCRARVWSYSNVEDRPNSTPTSSASSTSLRLSSSNKNSTATD